MIPENGILETLELLFQPGDVIELRSVGGLLENKVISGIYKDRVRLAEDAQEINANEHLPCNCYIVLNPLKPAAFDKAPHKDTCDGVGGNECAGAGDVLVRRWLNIDCDPLRDGGRLSGSKVSSTDEEKAAAEKLAVAIYEYLVPELGCDLPVADSGNGYSVLIPLDDVPVDLESLWVCQQLLQALGDKFDTPEAKVDRSTFDAPRLCGLFGTRKMKGAADDKDRPHRYSAFEHKPDTPLNRVTWEKLASLVPAYPGDPEPTETAPSDFAVNVPELLKEKGVAYTEKQKTRPDGTDYMLYELKVCVFNPEHDNGGACITQDANGKTGYRCFHDGCSGVKGDPEPKNWQAVKKLWKLGGVTREDVIIPATEQEALSIIRSLDVKAESIEWLSKDRIPLGGITLFVGRGGETKTFYACDLAARVSNRSLRAPDGQPLMHGRVLFGTAEDHIAKVIEPRMQAHDADRSFLEYIEGVPVDGYVQPMDLRKHCNMLCDVLQARPDTVLLILDPISCFQGDIDSHKVTPVRHVTAILSQIAETFSIAIIGIHHLAKGRREVAGDAISGSHAYRDASRMVWLFASDAADHTRRLVVADKYNWSQRRPLGLAYRIVNGRIEYESEPLDMTSEELMNQCTQKQGDIAVSWLATHLAGGARSAANVLIQAQMEGISDRTLKRAKKQLNVASNRRDGVWWWELPTEQEGQDP